MKHSVQTVLDSFLLGSLAHYEAQLRASERGCGATGRYRGKRTLILGCGAVGRGVACNVWLLLAKVCTYLQLPVRFEPSLRQERQERVLTRLRTYDEQRATPPTLHCTALHCTDDACLAHT